MAGNGNSRGNPPAIGPFADSSINFRLAANDVLVQCPYYAHKILESRLSTHLPKCMAQYRKDTIRNPGLPKYAICKFNWQHHVKATELAHHLETDCEQALRASVAEVTPVEFVEFDAAEPCVSSSSVSGVSISTSLKIDADVSVDVVPDTDTTGSLVFSGVETSVFSMDPESTPPVPQNKKIKQEFKPRPVLTRVRASGKEDWDLEAAAGPSKPIYNPKAAMEGQHVYYIPPGMTKRERREYREEMAARYAVKPKEEVVDDPAVSAQKKKAEDAEWERELVEAKRAAAVAAVEKKRALLANKDKDLEEAAVTTRGNVLFTPYGYDYDYS